MGKKARQQTSQTGSEKKSSGAMSAAALGGDRNGGIVPEQAQSCAELASLAGPAAPESLPRPVQPLPPAALGLVFRESSLLSSARLGSRDAPDKNAAPVGDVDVRFFEAVSDPFETEVEPRDPRLVAVRSIAAQRRRAHFAKYVVGAVAVCSALCLAALVKASVGRAYEQAGERASMVPAQAAAIESPAPRPAAADVRASVVPIAAVQPAPAPIAAAPSAIEAVAVAPSAREAVAVAPVAVAPSAATPVASSMIAASAPKEAVTADTLSPDAKGSSVNPAPVAPVASAREAIAGRELARTELGRGRAPQAIEAGERSVSLDPTDGEAWLILGAAYQQKGAIADARRCYKACLEQGKRGPRGECSAMLR